MKSNPFFRTPGVGKSTQAGLWETYQNGETINGDRALLQKENHIWVANGWPVCGTSRICKNISMPIHAIVMLSQSKENRVQQMKGLKAVQELYTQTTVNSWDIRAVNQSFDLLENLAGKVPIYHLACDISEEAVNCLKNALYKNNL